MKNLIVIGLIISLFFNILALHRITKLNKAVSIMAETQNSIVHYYVLAQTK